MTTTQANGIAVDAAGDAYVAGLTYTSDFPTTPGAFQTAFGGSSSTGLGDAFVSKLNAVGSLVYSTFLGGRDGDAANGIAVDTSGNAYVIGTTSSSNFPSSPGVFQTTLHGPQNAFVSKLNAGGSALIYSTYLGGSTSDYGYGIATNATGEAFVTGESSSSDFPTTPDAFQTTRQRDRRLRYQAKRRRFCLGLFHLPGRKRARFW